MQLCFGGRKYNILNKIITGLNQDLSYINRWLIANKLTEVMLIGSRQKLNSLSALPGLEINGTQLNRVNFIKSLGVQIDENLIWSNHINAKSKKSLFWYWIYKTNKSLRSSRNST